MNLGKQLKEGLLTQNPVLVQMLGLCSTMAITTSIMNGLGMGVSVLIILTAANVVISAIRKIVPDKIRIAMFIVVIAGFVTCVDLLLQAFVPAIAESLGVFIPLIVVNCIILGRAEAFSYKNGVGASFFDGIFQGLLHPRPAGDVLHPGAAGRGNSGGLPHHSGAVPHRHSDSARGRLPGAGLPHRRHAVGAVQE